eukprot:499444-Pyramimonas_sp.AAC.1
MPMIMRDVTHGVLTDGAREILDSMHRHRQNVHVKLSSPTFEGSQHVFFGSLRRSEQGGAPGAYVGDKQMRDEH